MVDFIRVICTIGLIGTSAGTISMEDEQQAWAIVGLCAFALVLLAFL